MYRMQWRNDHEFQPVIMSSTRLLHLPPVPITSRPLLDPYAHGCYFVWQDLTVTIYAPSGSYPNGTGLRVVREDIAKFLERRDSHPADPRHIFMGNGATDGIEVHVYYNYCTWKESFLFSFQPRSQALSSLGQETKEPENDVNFFLPCNIWLWILVMQSWWILLLLRNLLLLLGSNLECTCEVVPLFYPINVCTSGELPYFTSLCLTWHCRTKCE